METVESNSQDTNVQAKKQKDCQIAVRMSQACRDRFTEYCNLNHYSQAEGLEALLDANVLYDAAKRNPERAEHLASLNYHVQAVVDLFSASLTMAEDARARARLEFAAQLDQNDGVIKTYQERVQALEAEIFSLKADNVQITSALSAKASLAEELQAKAAQAQEQIADKSQMIAMLSKDLSVAQSEAASVGALKERVHHLTEDLRAATEALHQAELHHMQELHAQAHTHAEETRALETEMHHVREELHAQAHMHVEETRALEAEMHHVREQLAAAQATLSALQPIADNAAAAEAS